MKIGLASYKFMNGDIEFNLSQMEKAMKFAQGKADILCFGEAFAQGFDALNWDFEHDKDIAVSVDSEIMERLCGLTLQYQVDLIFGYFEREGNCIFSSCAVIEQGKMIYNYRRVSKGWKECSLTDEHYREGTEISGFSYKGRAFMIGLCGDLWEFPERFKTDRILIWPVYVDFGMDEWAKEEMEYARQANFVAGRALMVNSVSENPRAHGGAFEFAGGNIVKKSDYDLEEILIAEI